MSDTLVGHRLPDADFADPDGGWAEWKHSRPGDYMKVTNELEGKTVWYIRDPWNQVGALRLHAVVEHEDGTITVSSSILNPTPPPLTTENVISEDKKSGWHGWLQNGIWKPV